MKKIISISSNVLCLFMLLSYHIKAQTPPVVMQWGTHLDIKRNTSTSQDWCYAIKETSDGGFISCGYSGHSAGATVGPAIIKLDPNGNVVWHKEYDPTALYAYGALTDIIETSNGNFVAVGAQQGGAPNSALLILTDKFGNVLNTNSWKLPPRFLINDEYSSGICEAPDGDFLITVNSKDGILGQGFILKTNGYTISSVWNYLPYFGPGNNLNHAFSQIKIGKITNQSDFDIIVSGFHQVGQDVTINGFNCETPPNNVTKVDRNLDVDAYSIHYTSGVYTLNWHQVYLNSIFQANHYYDDKGPYSLLNGNGCCHSAFLDNYFNNIHQNAPAELIVSQDKKEIEICCYVGLIWPQDLPSINSIPGVFDCTRSLITLPGDATYGEYKDADGYVLKVNYSAGVVINPSAINPVHVGHYSGDDFRLGMVEDNCGNIYVTGTTADSEFDPIHSVGLIPPVIEDALVTKIANNHSRIWRRNFNSPGLVPNIVGGISFDENCPFNLVLKKEDNTVIIIGNNGENNDDMFFTKLSGDEQLLHSWDLQYYNAPIGITNWQGNGSPTPLSIKERILVQSGATLIIENCEIQFGETRELFDFNTDPSYINSHQSGIIVQKGGKVIVRNNAILRGLKKDPTNSCSRDYMWDGISIEGDPNALEAGLFQGVVEIYNGATIQDARCGMRFDSRTWFNNQPLPSQVVTNTEQWDRGRLSYPSAEGNGGGFVFADHAKFINNRKDVEFLPYTHSYSSNIFTNNLFSCSGPMKDPDFVFWDQFQEKYLPAGVNTHISIWDVHRIPFQGNTFENTGINFNWEHRGSGISSINADYELRNDNYFKKLTYGINASDINSAAKVSSFNSHFINNSHGIYNLGINFQEFVQNEFVVGLNEYDYDYGMYLEDCTGYAVAQNNFSNSNTPDYITHGIIDYFSYSNINNNLIYKNNFTNFSGAAALTEGFHNDGGINGLQLRCNTYIGNVYDEYTPNLVNLGQGQGIRNPQGESTPSNAANNKFNTSCSVLNGELYNEASPNVQAYTYNHCLNIAGATVVPASGCFTPNKVLLSPISSQYNPNFCGDIYIVPPPPHKKKIEMQEEAFLVASLNQTLDGGNQQALMSTIINGNTTEAMSALRSASPYVSSDVISLAVQSGIFSDDSLNAILKANSPLPAETMESMIADITVGSGNSAPDIQLNTNLLSNTTTDLEPEVQVRVNSIQVKNLTVNPSMVIAASKVTLTDADEAPSEDVSDSLQYISETPVQVEVSIGNYSSSEVHTAVGKLKLYKNGISPSDSISSLIRFYKSEYSRNFDQLVNLYLKDTTINGLDSVINILKKETGLNRKMQLAQTYIAKKDYTNAHQVLNNLQQYPELNNFVSMQNIFITLKEQNKSLFEIKTNSSLYQTVRFIADDSLHSGYSAARAILNLIDEIHYPEVIRFNNTSPSYRLRKEEVGFASGQILLRNYPNPFNNQTIIEAKIDDKLNQPMLIIYDLLGKEYPSDQQHIAS